MVYIRNVIFFVFFGISYCLGQQGLIKGKLSQSTYDVLYHYPKLIQIGLPIEGSHYNTDSLYWIQIDSLEYSFECKFPLYNPVFVPIKIGGRLKEIVIFPNDTVQLNLYFDANENNKFNVEIVSRNKHGDTLLDRWPSYFEVRSFVDSILAAHQQQDLNSPISNLLSNEEVYDSFERKVFHGLDKLHGRYMKPYDSLLLAERIDSVYHSILSNDLHNNILSMMASLLYIFSKEKLINPFTIERVENLLNTIYTKESYRSNELLGNGQFLLWNTYAQYLAGKNEMIALSPQYQVFGIHAAFALLPNKIAEILLGKVLFRSLMRSDNNEFSFSEAYPVYKTLYPDSTYARWIDERLARRQ